MHMTKRGEFLAIDTIHESTTNPRRTFDEAKLRELADFVPGNKIGLLWRSPFCGIGRQKAHGN
jgi:hypothetical protein